MSTKRLSLWAVLGVATLVNACGGGGGGGGCEQTGAVSFAHSPSIHAGGGPRLIYRLQQTNHWTLAVKGVTGECLSGVVHVGAKNFDDGRQFAA